MKRMFALLVALMVCLVFSACSTVSDTAQIKFKRHPQSVYEVGEPFGEFSLAIVDAGKTLIVESTDKDVSLSGFDSSTEGEKQLVISWRGLSKKFNYTVLLPESERPPEPGEITVYSLKELEESFETYGRIDVEANLTIEDGELFTVPVGKQVNIKPSFSIRNNGILFNNGKLIGELTGKFAIKEPVLSNGTFLIRSAQELAWMSYAMFYKYKDTYNNGQSYRILDGFSHFKINILNDIDISKHEWTPLGEWQFDTYDEYVGDAWLPGLARTFKGAIDGKGHTITGLNIGTDQSTLNRNVGFIGVADYEASITNLNFKNVTVRGTDNVGALIGYYHSHSWADGYIDNVTVEDAVVTGTNSVGGLIGRVTNAIQWNKINITNSSFFGTVNFDAYGQDKIRADCKYLGGIVGYAENGLKVLNNTVSAKFANYRYADGKIGEYAGGILGSYLKVVPGSGYDLVIDGNKFDRVVLQNFSVGLKEIGNV